MSVEALLGQAQGAWPLIKSTIRREQEIGNKIEPVRIVAGTFVREGEQELRKISDEIKKRRISIDPISDKNIFSQLPPDLVRPAILSYTAIFFGTSMSTIKQIVDEGVFRSSEMVKLLNYSMHGTFIPQLRTINLGMVSLSANERKRLKDAQTKDSSLSVLLTDEIDKIPDILRKLLSQSGTFPLIKRLFIPSYRDKVIRFRSMNGTGR